MGHNYLIRTIRDLRKSLRGEGYSERAIHEIFYVKWGRCPRCGVHDLLVEVPGLKAFCRGCLRKAIRILEEASGKPLSREDIERIMREE